MKSGMRRNKLFCYLSRFDDRVHPEAGQAVEVDLLVAVEDLEGLADGRAADHARGEHGVAVADGGGCEQDSERLEM